MGWLNNACQRFRFAPTGDGFVRIENERSGRVLDAAGCGGAGANVQLWDWLGNACQQFRLEPAGRVLILGIDVRGCRTRCQWDFGHTELGYSTVTERRSARRSGAWFRATTTRTRSGTARATSTA